jgi:hypothetical protein
MYAQRDLQGASFFISIVRKNANILTMSPPWKRGG